MDAQGSMGRKSPVCPYEQPYHLRLRLYRLTIWRKLPAFMLNRKLPPLLAFRSCLFSPYCSSVPGLRTRRDFPSTGYYICRVVSLHRNNVRVNIIPEKKWMLSAKYWWLGVKFAQHLRPDLTQPRTAFRIRCELVMREFQLRGNITLWKRSKCKIPVVGIKVCPDYSVIRIVCAAQTSSFQRRRKVGVGNAHATSGWLRMK